jgi:hypothetical protein
MTYKVLNIYFRKKDIRLSGDYFYFPTSAMDSPLSNLAIPAQTDRSERMNALRKSVRDVFKEVGEYSEILGAEANRCFYWVFWPLFRDGQVLIDFIRVYKFSEIIMHGKSVSAYSAMANRGDESRPFLYFPDFLYPEWIVSILSNECKIKLRPPKARTVKFYLSSKLRNLIVCLGKILIMLAQRFVFLTSPHSKLTNPKNLDYIFLARGTVAIEFFEKLGKKLLKNNKTGAIYLNLSPRQLKLDGSIQRSLLSSTVGTFNLGSFSGFLLILSGLKRLFNKYPSIHRVISDGVNSINFNFSAIIAEFECAYPDTYIHRILIKRLLVNSPEAVVLSTELVSEYVHFESTAAKYSGHPYLTFQAFAVEASDAVNLALGDGMIVQSESLRQEISELFPSISKKVWYFGDLDYREEVLNFEHLRRVVFFSQPYDLDSQQKIVSYLCDSVFKLHSDTEIIIKLHPRDNIENYSKFRQVKFVRNGEVSNDELISECDLVVSRCSSILHVALMLGVPYLACTFTSYERNFSPPYLSDELGVRVFSLEEMNSKINFYLEYSRQYACRRKNFLCKQEKPFDFDLFCAQQYV